MEKLDTDKSVLLVSRDTMATLLRGYNEWNSLTVRMTDSDEAKLVRGELASILEIPRPKKQAAAVQAVFDHPFRLSKETVEGEDFLNMNFGRIQLVNFMPGSFVTVPGYTCSFEEGTYVWVQTTQTSAEEKNPPNAVVSSGFEIPSDAREHKLTYWVSISEGAYVTEVDIVESQTFVHYHIIGKIEDGEIIQFRTTDIEERWSPITAIAGSATTIP